RSNYPSFQMIWCVDRSSLDYFINYVVRYVRRFSLRWLYLMNRSKYWFSNSRLPLWVCKPNKTIYVQTWHGTTLKRLALDMQKVHMPGTNTEKYKKNFVRAIKNGNI